MIVMASPPVVRHNSGVTIDMWGMTANAIPEQAVMTDKAHGLFVGCDIVFINTRKLTEWTWGESNSRPRHNPNQAPRA